MRPLLPVLLVAACLNSGCITAARRIEQAIRRSAADDSEENRPAARRREPAVLPPAVVSGDVAVNPGHPRLFVGRDWPAATDDVGRDWQAVLRKRADDTLTNPPVEYSQRKLLIRSRSALKRLSLLAGVYRMTGDAKYADAAKAELLNVCAFDDWQPNDFLATAEMMTAVGIGYDWLYDTLKPADRKAVVAAIIAKGLQPALEAYSSQGGWTRAQHNWNLVCNGGVIVASLAVAEENPTLAKKMLSLALQSIRYGLSAYDTNGGTEEGPMYHSYATRYLAFAAAAMATATDAGDALLAANDKPRPWAGAPKFRMDMTGPSGKVANFGDGYETLGNTAWMLWIARQPQAWDPAAVTFQARTDHDDPSIFDLLWYAAPAKAVPARMASVRPPAIAYGSSIVLRSPDGKNFLALRTGGTADHHSHLDLGNFVLDLGGTRFAHDLGPDNYGLPGYLGPRRADYLRSSTPGHNTLTIGEASQPGDADAKATVVRTDGPPSAKIDMTEAYPGAKSVVRTVTLDGRVATITDDLRLSKSATFVWHLHTPAAVTPSGNGATLEADGQRVELKILEPADAKLTVEPDATRPPQQPVEGSSHVRIKVKVDGAAKIVVQFRPAE